MRRQTATLAVVALLLVAGCSAFGGGGTTTGPDDGQTGDALYETPLDAEAVADAHAAALRDAGSYTVESNATRTDSSRNQTTETSTLIRGDLDSGAIYTRTAARQQTVEGFGFANGTAYQRFATGDRVQYMNATGRLGNATQYARGTVAQFAGLFNFSYAGTSTVDGTTVHVYEASGPGALNTSAPAWSMLNESDVESAQATLHVREDGVITRAGYDITVTLQGSQQRVDVTQRFTAIGETTVEPPVWIPDARQNTSQSNSSQ